MKLNTAVIAILFSIGSANAADFSFTGNFTDNNEVQEFNFSVADPGSDVTLRTWSYAGGTNAAGAAIDRGGFDPVVTLFDSTGTLIDRNDDSSGNVARDQLTGFAWDSFLMHNLSTGNYTATLTQFSNFANGPLLTDGFLGSQHPNFGSRDSHWALDIVNANAASAGNSYVITPIPEPESYALLLAGLGLISFMARRRYI